MKSAAEFKPVGKSGAERKMMRKQLDDMPSLEETWENAKQSFVNTADVAAKIATRIDNLMNIRDLVYKFWGDGFDASGTGMTLLEYFKSKQDLSVDTYKEIADIVRSFEMDEFLKDEMKDYFEDVIPKVEDIEDEDQLLDASIIFLTVKPWGEKMTALHHTMLDEKKQREYLEG